MMNRLADYKPLLWILVIPVLNVFYGILNNGNGHVSSLVTVMDEQIPFVPAFIVPYLLWYPFVLIMLIVLFVKNARVYYRTLLALGLGLIACYLIYYFFQTTITRPQASGNGILLQLVRLVYEADGAYNCFPSIHVLTSYLMLKGMSDCNNFSRASRKIILTASWSVTISTVFVKQHVLLDIIGAIVLAELVYLAVGRWLATPRRSEDIKGGCLQWLQDQEHKVFYWCNHKISHPFLDRTSPVLTHMGGAVFTITTTLSISVFAPYPWKAAGCQSLAALAVSHLFAVMIKKLTGRARPYLALPQAKLIQKPLKDHSFPSGHTTAAFGVIVPFLFVSPFLAYILLPLAVGVGLSRIYRGVHYPSDCLVGAIIGTICGLLAVLLI
ncbi:Undecaprenyl-diphosphatase BcrC [compost metagenome]